MKTITAPLVIISTLLCLAPPARATTRTWSGAGPNNFWTNAANWGGTAPVAGDDLLFPGGAARLTSTNNFPSNTTFHAFTFSGNSYLLNGNTVALDAGLFGTFASGSSSLNLTVRLNADQSFTNAVNTTISLNFATNFVDLNGHTLTCDGGGSLSLGLLTGSGNLIQAGSGTTTLNKSNAYTGTTTVNAGTLQIQHSLSLGASNNSVTVGAGGTLALRDPVGNQPLIVPQSLALSGTLTNVQRDNTWAGPITLGGSPVFGIRNVLTLAGAVSGGAGLTKRGDNSTLVLSGASYSYTGTTLVNNGQLAVNGVLTSSPIVLDGPTAQLVGTGTVASVTFASNGGSVSPGYDTSQIFLGPGKLNCGNLTLNGATTYFVELNGTTPGSGHDQLNVTGTVNLGGATLSIISLGFTPAVGSTFTIIANDGADAVTGTFAGLPQGAILTVGTTPLQISYTGGDGNDVVLTVLCDAPPAPVNLRIGQLGPEPSRVFIQWNPVTPACGAVQEYILFRDGFDVGHNSNPGVVDALMIAGHTYTFTAAVVNTNGLMSGLSTGFVVTALSPNPIVGTQKVVNLLVRFADFTDSPFDTNFVNSLMFTSNNSVRAFYEENSYGKFSLSGSTYGWYTLPKKGSNYCNLYFSGNPEGYDCDVNDIRTDALALLPFDVAAEVSAADVVQFLVHGMGTVGLSAGPNKYYSATNGFSRGTVIHETSHGLNSLLHAGSWSDCDLYTVGPDLVNLTDGGCFVARYGDLYDPLGAGATFHHNSWFKEKLGWITSNNVVNITTNGEYILNRLETPTNGTQVLKYDLGNDQFYFLEYRTLTGFDGPGSPETGGITPIDRVLVRLRVSRPPGTDCETLHLFRVFNGPTSFLDPYRGFQVDLISKSNGVARLRVTMGVNYSFRVTDLHRTGTGNRNVSMTWNSVPGLNYFVEGSTNLTSWQQLQTFIFAAGTTVTNVVNNVGTNQQRYFRVGSLPNP